MCLYTTGVPVAAAGSTSSVATDPVPPSLVSQHSSSSLGSGGNKNSEDKQLVGCVDQTTPVSTKRSDQDSRESDEILNILKASQEQTKKALGQIGSTLVSSSPDVKIPGAFGWRQM